MTWYVRSRARGGTVASTVVDTPSTAKEIFDAQVGRGRSAWIEDHKGQRLARKDLDDA
jgi:hypothetical protein